MNKNKVIILALVIVAVISILGNKFYKNNIVSQSAEIIVDTAIKEHKPVWILFRSQTWATCIQMSKVFAQVTPDYKDTLVYLESDVNAKESFTLVDRFKIMTIPTSVLIDAQGNVKEKFSGYYSPEQMKEKINLLIK